MLNRRNFLAVCSSCGLAGTLFPGALWSLAQEKEKITPGMIDEAAKIADVPIPPEDRQMMLGTLNEQVKDYDQIYALHLANGRIRTEAETARGRHVSIRIGLLVADRQHDDLDFRQFGLDQAQRRQPIKVRHVDVHQDHFGLDGDRPRNAQPLLLSA